MCTRFRSIKTLSELPFTLPEWPTLNFEFNPNVAPTEVSPFIASIEGRLEFKLGHFGISKPNRGPLLNARTDSISKGLHKKLVANQRCVIPAQGFYEFREEENKKYPYYFCRKDELPIIFAGIWDWSEVKGQNALSFALLTDEPNPLVAPFHDRMPLIVEDPMPWLNGEELKAIQPLEESLFTVKPVNPLLNKWQTKDLDIIDNFVPEKNRSGLFE